MTRLLGNSAENNIHKNRSSLEDEKIEEKSDFQEQTSLDSEAVLESELTNSYEKELDSSLKEQEKLSEDLSNDSYAKNSSELFSIGLESLKNLGALGENALKTLSAETARFLKNNFLMIKLRSSYIEKKSKSLTKRLEKNTESVSKEEINNFLKTIKAGYWDGGSEVNDLAFNASRFLETLYNKKGEQFSEEIADVWPILINQSGISPDHSYWGNFLENEAIKLLSLMREDIIENREHALTLIDEIDNDFIALELINNIPGRDDVFNKSILKHIDNIIESYPNFKALPLHIFKIVQSVAADYPNLILADSRRRQFLLSSWLYWRKERPSRNSSSAAPLFIGDVAEYNKEETKKIADKLFSNWTGLSNDNDDSLILHLSIDEKNLEKAVKKYSNLKDDSLIKLKQISLKQEKSRDGESNSVLLTSLLEVARETCAAGKDPAIFLSYLINNFPNEKRGIGEKELEDILKELLTDQSKKFDLAELKVFQAVFEDHNWPENLQEFVFNRNRVASSDLNEIITGSDEKYAWIRNNKALFLALERSFYKHGKKNDRRHNFYNVLDGTAKTNDFDSLIKGYADSIEHCDAQELITIFINKGVDKKYVPLFTDGIYLVHLYEFLSESLKAGRINKDDYLFFFELAFEHGNPYLAPEVIKKIKNDGLLDDKQLELFLEKLSDNVVNYFDKEIFRDGGYRREAVVGNFLSNDYIDCFGDKANDYIRKTIDGMIKSDSSDSIPVWLLNGHLGAINSAYPDLEERKAIVEKSLLKLSIGSNENNKFFDLYFHNREFFSILDDDKRNKIEENIFLKNIKIKSDYFLENLSEMSEDQRKTFERIFLSNFNYASFNCDNFFSILASEDYFIFPEITASFYRKVLGDKNIKSNIARVLFNINVFRQFPDIEKMFIDNLSRWTDFDGVGLLNAYVLPDVPGQSLLDYEKVKFVSENTIKSHGLSIPFWRGYASSDKNKPAFYLDANLYELGLKNIGDALTKERSGEIVNFMKELESSEFGLNKNQKIHIIRSAFREMNGQDIVEKITDFYNYDPLLAEEAFSDYVSTGYLEQFLDCSINFSPDFNKLLLKAGLSDITAYNIHCLAPHFKRNNNLEALATIKKAVDSLKKNNDNVWNCKKVLFDLDLLDAKEAHALYKEVSSNDNNVRQQILQSIDIIGSVLSNAENINKLDVFFDKKSPERITDLQNIAAFMSRYLKENKGRTIVTMLFAREYLPDRKLEEVVEKVALYLNKYEKILEENSYKNIPEGIRASIGMEYEITSSTAEGYKALTNEDLSSDINKLSEIARIGSGKDAVHEIATRPTDNPYLMLLEMKLLHDLEYVDLNFDRSEKYQKGARGFHLTLGGEKGLTVDRDTHFLQNVIAAASWSGIMTGETGHKVNGGRGVSMRGRNPEDNNNIAFFGKKTSSVELRSLAIDTQETLQRTVITAFNGAIAIQACRQYLGLHPVEIIEKMQEENGRQELDKKISKAGERERGIINAWLDLIEETIKTTESHNSEFLERESYGYMDDKEVWVENDDFNGRDNKERFESIVHNIDPTLSLEEYCQRTVIEKDELFSEFNVGLSDKLIKINNLFIKPGIKYVSEDKEREIKKEKRVFKGDHANAISVLKSTKFDNSTLEYKDEDYLKKTVFDTAGDKREGYYNFQGGSERMITHAIQRALLKFNREIEKIVC